jgi:hypothetical protein
MKLENLVDKSLIALYDSIRRQIPPMAAILLTCPSSRST